MPPSSLGHSATNWYEEIIGFYIFFTVLLLTFKDHVRDNMLEVSVQPAWTAARARARSSLLAALIIIIIIIIKIFAHSVERFLIFVFYVLSCSPNTNEVLQCPVEEKKAPHLYLQLKEEEQVRKKLVQKVSDLTSDLYLKEAELQYCNSQVIHYRNEAVLMARGACCLKNDLSEYEYKLECQSKALATLQLEQRTMREELALARKEKEELLERWLEEKREEAERINTHNAALERWNSYARRLNRRLHSGRRRQTLPTTNN